MYRRVTLEKLFGDRAMEKGNTKQEILAVALDLFSTQGFEATSVSQIAEAVGIRKASLYSHFASKQEILDALTAQAMDQYDKRSIFIHSDWDNAAFAEAKRNLSVEEVERLVFEQIRYILHDPLISKARKMLTVEQFRNAQMAELQTKQNYTSVMQYFIGLMQFFIRNGRLKDCDPEIMAAQLCLPVSVWINLCDREPEREEEAMSLIGRHIRQFFKTYGTDETGIATDKERK